MASRKPKRGKEESTGVKLSSEQQQEVEMLLDRLRVQDPRGMSLESYLQSLRGALNGKEAIVLALLEKLSKPPTAVGYRMYLMVKDLFAGKNFRRAVKQAGYRFQQAGYRDDSMPASTREITLIPSEEKKPIARMSSPDEEGGWVLTALLPDAQLGRVYFSMVLRSPLRVLEAMSMECSLRLYRHLMKENGLNLPGELWEIPIWHLAKTAFDALENNAEACSPEQIRAARRLLKPYYDPDRLPYAYELLPALEHPEEHLGEIDIAALLRNLPHAGLLFPKKDLQPLWERLQQVDTALVVVPPAVREQRARAIAGAAADEICAGKTRYGLQRFLEEQALLFKLEGKEDLARSAWIAAQHLRSSQPAHANPVVEGLVNISLYYYWHDDFERENERPTDQKVDAGFYQTESGLVLPR
jgi:hypothetical protein